MSAGHVRGSGGGVAAGVDAFLSSSFTQEADTTTLNWSFAEGHLEWSVVVVVEFNDGSPTWRGVFPAEQIGEQIGPDTHTAGVQWTGTFTLIDQRGELLCRGTTQTALWAV